MGTTINNRAPEPGIRLSLPEHLIALPQEGLSYAHHPFLTHFSGRFRAIWSGGVFTEDAAGQCVMMADSADGEHWSTPRALMTPQGLGNSNGVLTAAGFHAHGGVLNVYFGYYEYQAKAGRAADDRPEADAEHCGTVLFAVSSPDGRHWSAPRSLGLRCVPNHAPQPISGGRLILSGNVMFPYTDDLNGLSNFRVTGIYGDAFGQEEPYDDSDSIWRVRAFQGWKANLICEGSFFETDDGVVHMMLRSNTEHLWCTESTDRGETWSVPEPTAFVNGASKFHFGRLPDGTFYCVSNAIVEYDRHRLDLHLSQDGVNFNRHYVLRDEPYSLRFPDWRKQGVYGYPHTLVHGGSLWVIYSKCKEEIALTEVPLDRLSR